MAINTTTIIGDVFLPSGAVREKSYVIFEMTGFDTDAPDGATVVPYPIRAAISAGGAISQALWPNADGVRTTFYRVTFEIYGGTAPVLVDAGKIVVPVSGGPYVLNDLLPVAPPADADVDDYIAYLAAAVGTATTAASTASAAASSASASADDAAASAALIGSAMLGGNNLSELTNKAKSLATLRGFTETATAAGTTTLTAASSATQRFTGATTQTVVLPVAATLVDGWVYDIDNSSTGALTVNSSGGNLVAIIPAGTTASLRCILASGTTAASWSASLAAALVYTNRASAAAARLHASVGSISTLGYSTEGDGGGAIYKRAASEPAHGGKIQTADGAWWALTGTRYNVEVFGAVGDNTTNDTAAFLAAMVYFKAVGRGYLVANKTYKVTTGVKIDTTPYVTIDGEGSGIINCAGVGDFDHGVYAVNSNYTVIRRITVNIPRANLRVGGMGMLLSECDHSSVIECNTDGGLAAIWFKDCEHVLALNNYVDTPKADGIHFGHGTSYAKAIGNTIVNSGDDAISMTYYTGYPVPHDIMISDNIVNGTIWGAGVAIYSAYRVIVTGNQLNSIACSGIKMEAYSGGSDPYNCIIADNMINGAAQTLIVPYAYWGTGADTAAQTDFCGIAVLGARVTVVNNLIRYIQIPSTGAARHGITLYGGDTISIKGNTMQDVKGRGVSCTAAGLGNVFVTNNDMNSVAGDGVRFGSTLTAPVVISGNSFGLGQTTENNAMVRVSGTAATKVMVANNISTQGRGVSVDVATATNVTTANNTF